ncbi:hypothetical protein [Methylophilus methylotrophus]|uniref:hypothetical protein n=1 Tax=Methylophilus methylotrophus TaxID=17 RepID=UPI00233EB39B|nr:hypothetical protein [Methylophilus methylotrophus]
MYFEMARHFAMGDWDAGKAVEGYTWGFYPGLIALVHVITGLGLQASANLLIVSFFILLVSGLMRLVRIAGGNESTQSYAVLLLLGSGYIVGDILPMASRDLGYWAVMIHAVNQLILFYQHGRWKHAIHWQLLGLLAMLFRIEGAVQLLVLPLVGFIFSAKASRMIKPYALLIAGMLCLPLGMFFSSLSLDDLGRVKELFTGLQDIQLNVQQNLTQRVQVMRDQVIGEPFQEYAWVTFLLAYFSIATLKCLTVAGWAPTLLAFAERHSIKKSIEPVAYKILLFWMALSWLIGCLITFKVNLLSARYVALFGFALIIFASFALQRLLHDKRPVKMSKQVIFGLSAIILMVGFVSNIKSKPETFYYEIDAVRYVKSKLMPDQQVLYASAKQRFYAGVAFDTRFDYSWEALDKRIAAGELQQYEYILLKFGDSIDEQKKLAQLRRQLTAFKLEKVFYGHKNKKRVLIFKRAV